MIVVCGVGDEVNNINCIMGRETDAHIAVHGSIELNLSMFMAALDASKPVVLKLTRCDSELTTATAIAQLVSQGMQVIPAQHALYVIAGAAASAPAATPAAGAPAPPSVRCSCGLDPEPGKSLCRSCEAIEVGLRAVRKKPGTKRDSK